MDGEKDQDVSDGDTKRKAIRDKVAAAQADLAKPAVPERDPPEGLKALAMDYPFALMLGGVAAGVVIGALLPKGAARKLTRGAIAAATVAGELGLTYGRNTLEAANETAATVTREGRLKLEDLSGKLADLSESVGENANEAGKRALAVASDAAEGARGTGLRLARQVIKLTSQLRH